MTKLDEFRAETRAWLEQNCPLSMRGPLSADAISDSSSCWGGRKWVFASEDQRQWLERMGARGWTAPEWPRAYGGGGLDKAQARCLREELARIQARSPLESFGISMLGPALLRYGNEEQKLRFLPPIVRGEIRWCQGYSEPNAGSDLAGLQTRAEDKGDHFLVNGQKVWTSAPRLSASPRGILAAQAVQEPGVLRGVPQAVHRRRDQPGGLGAAPEPVRQLAQEPLEPPG